MLKTQLKHKQSNGANMNTIVVCASSTIPLIKWVSLPSAI